MINMALEFPRWWQPAIGYAMNRIGKGEDRSTVLERMIRSDEYGDIGSSRLQEIYAIASANMAASRRATQGPSDESLFGAFGAGAGHLTQISARVICHTTDTSGNARDVSVLVNIDSQASKEDIMEFVHSQLLDPGGALYGAYQYQIAVVDPDCEIFLYAGYQETGLQF
jgi:hypothetical protein